MKILKILTLSILIVSCSKELPKNSKIIAKYIVFNHDISKKTIQNFDNVKELNNSNEITRPFVIDKKFHDLEYAFILNLNGTLEKLSEYKYNQSELYKKYQIELDTIDIQNIGVGFMIKLNEKRNQIIDGRDTLNIVDIYSAEKLIRVEKPEKKGRVVYYQYK